MKKVPIAISIALVLTPLLSEFISCLTVASSLVFTRNIPIIERNTPIAAIIIGAKMAFLCISGFKTNAEAPNAAVESIEPQYDS